MKVGSNIPTKAKTKKPVNGMPSKPGHKPLGNTFEPLGACAVPSVTTLVITSNSYTRVTPAYMIELFDVTNIVMKRQRSCWLLEKTSFMHSQIDQNTAAAPTKLKFCSFQKLTYRLHKGESMCYSRKNNMKAWHSK